MQPVPEKSTIVIAGSFNPAILTPAWIGKNVLDPPIVEEFPVYVMATIMGPAQVPRYSVPGFSYSPGYQNLTFHLEGLDATACQRVCEVAARILGLLPHTPTTGIGFNLGFRDDNPSVQLLRLLAVSPSFADALGQGAEVVGRNWLNVASWGSALVTLQTGIRGSEFALDLNFHYTVQDARGAESVLREQGVYAKHQAAANRIVAASNEE
jgi:hypothetical protein